MTIQVGDSIPDFELLDQKGHTVRFFDLYQKSPIVLYFYPKDDTPGCTTESCTFRDQYEDFKEAGAIVVGISSDSPGSHLKFAAKHRLPFTLLSDTEGQVRKLFGVSSTLGLLPGRVTYVINRSGIVRHVFSSQFNPRKHVAEALRVLKSMGE